MAAITNNEANELGRIFARNGTTVDVMHKLSPQYPHVDKRDLAGTAALFDRMNASAEMPAPEAAADAARYEAARTLQGQVNRAEADLTKASIQDLEATLGAYLA
jgi:hypothetical protein